MGQKHEGSWSPRTCHFISLPPGDSLQSQQAGVKAEVLQ